MFLQRSVFLRWAKTLECVRYSRRQFGHCVPSKRKRSLAITPWARHMWTHSPAKEAKFSLHCMQPKLRSVSMACALMSCEGIWSTHFSWCRRCPIRICNSRAWNSFFLWRHACWMPLLMSFFQKTLWCTMMSYHCKKWIVGSARRAEVPICCHNQCKSSRSNSIHAMSSCSKPQWAWKRQLWRVPK